eukprot:TRINITY_DN66920_c0_g1_i1.p1 TRINITY_DN66920_c0_g1~~TRINITY_DN66920_c0_g1_i1.p1  ORF type:complete len:261 (+),score=63.92 TRINITY_DN66920_c0_g1_i1:75-785(+)
MAEDEAYLSSVGFADLVAELRSTLLSQRPADAAAARQLVQFRRAPSGAAQDPDTAEAQLDISGDRSCEKFRIRKLELGDYHKGFLDALSQLTTVGEVSEAEFAAQLDHMNKSNGSHNVLVAEDADTGLIVATGAILLERKFVHACGLVGHIEDVVVLKTVRGQKLGQRIVEALQEIGTKAGCYKIILDCARSNMPFYERQKFYEKEVQMRYDCLSPRSFRERSNFVGAAPAGGPHA